MNADDLLRHYKRIVDAPDAVARLRRFILDLAVRGKLVPQDPKDEPASELIKKIAAEKSNASGSRQRQEVSIKAAPSKTWSFSPPCGWVWVLFGDVVISRDGERIPVSRDDRNARAKRFDYYGASGVIDKIDAYLFDKPLLLIGEDGANLVNRSTPIAFIARGKYWVNNHAHVLDATSEGLLQYLELFINATDLTPYITGTAQPKMNQAKMNSIPVALPPLAEQHRIVSKVNELMALCDRLEAARAEREAARDRLALSCLARLNAPDPETFVEDARFALDALPALTARPDQIKQLRETILNLAVRGKLVPQDPAECLSEHVRDASADHESAVPLMPSTWRRMRIETLCNAVVDCPHSTPKFVSSGVVCLDTNAFKNGALVSKRIRYVSEETYKERIRRLVPEAGDIVFAREGSVGESVIVPDGLRCCLGQRVMLFRPGQNITPQYFQLALSAPSFLSLLLALHKGIGAKHVNVSDMRAASLPLPPIAEQHRIVAKVDELMALCDRLEASMKQADDHRRHLLEALLHEALQPAAALEEAA